MLPAPFASAARRAGGQLIASGRIPIQAIVASIEAEEAERKRRQELALLEQQRVAEEAEPMVVGRGTLIGELALLTDMVCPATAIAKEPTVVIRFWIVAFVLALAGLSTLKLR